MTLVIFENVGINPEPQVERLPDAKTCRIDAEFYEVVLESH